MTGAEHCCEKHLLPPTRGSRDHERVHSLVTVLLVACGVCTSPLHAQQLRRGPGLVLDAALSGHYDSNALQDRTAQDLYGGAFDLLARFTSRPTRPTVQLEYGAGRRASSPTTAQDVLTQRASTLLGLPLLGGSRLELIGRGISGGVDEDQNRQRELYVMPRIEWEVNRYNRIRIHGAHSWREAGTDTALTLGRILGIEYRHRFGRAATFQAGYRDDTSTPPDSAYAWRRSAVTADIGVRTGSRSALELGARYSVRDYPKRLLSIDDAIRSRRDEERRASLSWVFRSGSGTEVRAGYSFEMRTSNDARRAFDAHRVGLSFRQTVLHVGGQTTSRFDEDRWDLTAQRTAAARLSFAHVATVGSSVCGISTGVAHCWTGTTEAPPRRSHAVTAPGGATWLTLAAGPRLVCGLTRAGAAYCWPLATNGQPESEPIAVRGGSTFSSIVVGIEHVCALTSAGAAFCWGTNRDAALGNGSLANSSTPVPVAGGHTFRALAAGARHTCGITTSADVYCWGGNAQGQLGWPHGHRFLEPQPLAPLRLTSISAGTSHTCGIDLEGAAWCWGQNGRGQLGNATTGGPSSPVRVNLPVRLSSITSGWAHTCAVAEDGSAFCWGQNRYGQLGLPPDDQSHSTPTPAMPHLRFAALSASFRTCGLTTDARVICWGAEGAGAVEATTPAR